MNSEDKIALVGMMGCGKSTVGKRIAQVLDFEYVDLDTEFERIHGSIEKYFKEHGEVRFRIEESKLLENLSQKSRIVLSTGGGILENKRNVEILKNMRTFYLSVDPEILWQRTKNSQRPLVKEGRENFLKRFEKRKPLYEIYETINATSLNVEEVMASIVKRVLKSEKIDEFDLYQHVEIFHNQNLKDPDLSMISKKVKRIWKLDGFEIDDGEEMKSISSVENVWNFFNSKGLSRNSRVRIIGGGTITDMVGFACTTYMRGIDFELFPTTFLGMVDASIGGKFAINFNGVKNLIGTFGKPDVFIDPTYTLSLKYENFVEGVMESAKIGIIYDKELFEYMEKNVERIKSKNLKVIDEIVKISVKDKLEIIGKDPQDKELRHLLNFGHTVAHGIESATNNNISHGQAVAIGMIIESKLFSSHVYERIKRFVNTLLRIEEIDGWERWIKSDKKRIENSVLLPVVDEIGRSHLEKIEIKNFFRSEI